MHHLLICLTRCPPPDTTLGEVSLQFDVATEREGILRTRIFILRVLQKHLLLTHWLKYVVTVTVFDCRLLE